MSDKNGRAMYGSKPLNVYHGGQRWGGWWEIERDEILVSSAYGWKTAPLRGRDPEKAAEKLLLQIVRERGHGR